MTFQCPKCGYKDSPIWKPLYWKLYGSYADFADFYREHKELAQRILTGEELVEDEYFDTLDENILIRHFECPKCKAIVEDSIENWEES